jgi:UDPglucose--hexose-1-phosphate uridylyltransferase
VKTSHIDISYEIARLIRFGETSGLLQEGDTIVSENALLDLFKVNEPYAGDRTLFHSESPVPILEKMLDFAASQGQLPDNTTGYRDLLDARIMGLLMPRQSEVTRQFWQLAENSGVRAATDWFYRLSIDSNYIRMDRIRKNEYWLAPTSFGDLEITINLSKPEKDPKEIAAERALPQANYPKCLLCVENVGYAGRLNHPARQNHRVIPLTLDGGRWNLQYSPYVYYNEHCIIFSNNHTPMTISEKTFIRLLGFVQQFPHYFVGSNADLPIVGGSILSHDHFQGGFHSFPMEKAPVHMRFTHPGYDSVEAGIVNWPMSVIRIAGSDSAELTRLATYVLEQWRAYSDPEAEILSHSEDVPHNTITPIARINKTGQFEMDLVLRNNRTSENYPHGIFHPHDHLHHIKKENIGLIEVMGLAVLPGRLKQELEQIRPYLTGANTDSINDLQEPSHHLHKHAHWIVEMVDRCQAKLTNEQAVALLQAEVGNKFMQVLSDAGVYKNSTNGWKQFAQFMQALGFQPE